MDEKIFYEVEDLQELLQVSRGSIYKYVQEVYKAKSPFPIIKVGNLYRIPKKAFDRYISGE